MTTPMDSPKNEFLIEKKPDFMKDQIKKMIQNQMKINLLKRSAASELQGMH